VDTALVVACISGVVALDGQWAMLWGDEISRTPPQERMTTHEHDLRKHLRTLKAPASSL
jgi:hypothetical protein